MDNSVAIIGGGASGLMAAVFAARNGADVTVYEGETRVGRKILATGNGRCNITNLYADVEHYHGRNPEFILGAKKIFWVDETIDFFKKSGVLTKVEDEGKVYPYSDQASAVLDVLRYESAEAGVKAVTEFEVKSVIKEKDGFRITAYDGRSARAESIIIASGGKAAPNLGSKGGGYDILKSFGHHITELAPSLVQIKTETDVVRKLKGIKLTAKVSLGNVSESGEVLFTEYGISGPAVFSISSRLEGQKEAVLDIMPEYTYDEVYDMIVERVNNMPSKPLEDFFVGMLNKRLGQAIFKLLGIEPLSRYSVTLNEKEIRKIVSLIKRWSLRITGTMSWNNAQTTRGGAITDEFIPETMASKLVEGLYAVGEVLDIDGDCGGFNLQWAWSSGALAGMAVSKRRTEV